MLFAGNDLEDRNVSRFERSVTTLSNHLKGKQMSYFTNSEAIDLWKMKFSGIGPSEIAIRMKRNPFRVYEVLAEKKNYGTRVIAFEEFAQENPAQAANVDPSPHVQKRRVISAEGEQPKLF